MKIIITKDIETKSFKFTKTKGKFTHTIETSNQYKICIRVSSELFVGRHPVKMKINIAK